MSRLLLPALIACVAFPSHAAAGRFAVGVEHGASLAEVAARVEAATGGSASRTLAPLRALLVDAASADGVSSLEGVSYVDDLRAKRRLAFVPNDPLAPRQWHLAAIRAFDWWPQPPLLPAVRVAVIDSGVDVEHPQLRGRLERVRSFVDRSPHDRHGHGTFVAGEIAAATNDGLGVAGIAFPARLLVAKVVRPDGTVSLEAEARAIRWAVDRGADVVNLSLAGVRAPGDSTADTYSPLEASAVDYAVRRGAVVVAAVGNSDGTPARPWRFASYPAALPHVVGVSAFARDGSVPAFSNRDLVFNDVTAPGEAILSTFPRSLTAAFASCPEQGYSSCAPARYRRAEGTSFAAAQVSAAAALVLSARPGLAPEQVAFLLERSAQDASAANGCRACRPLRDPLTGWGRLDVASALGRALQSPLPPRDTREPNDGIGRRAATIPRSGEVRATIDFWDDPVDVYRVRLARGDRLSGILTRPPTQAAKLSLWRASSSRSRGRRVARSARIRNLERLRPYPARVAGWYYLRVAISKPGSGAYTLRVARR